MHSVLVSLNKPKVKMVNVYGLDGIGKTRFV
jgi:hypothetical protein